MFLADSRPGAQQSAAHAARPSGPKIAKTRSVSSGVFNAKPRYFIALRYLDLVVKIAEPLGIFVQVQCRFLDAVMMIDRHTRVADPTNLECS